ncbi:ATP-dependent DNA helicase 2 subunit KU80 [Linum grandiflorum]
MARNKENMVLVLDVGPTMHALLPQVERVCSMLIEKKLIYHRADEVGIVLFGTEDTDNELTKEVGGYEHVSVLQNLKVVDGDLVSGVHQLPRGTVHGDYLDAIVVGVDLLLKKYNDGNKGKKRVCLITNAQCAVKDPTEGTKEDQVSMIAKHMETKGIGFETIVVRGPHTEGRFKSIMDENDHLLNLFSTKTSAKIVYVHNPTSLLGALRTRNITPVTIFRGDLEIGLKMKIKVWVYKKTSEEKFPTLKKYSDKAPQTDKFATHDVKVDYEYRSVEDADKVVPPDQRIKGYRYGPQVVPIASAEWDAVKFKTEKGVKLLGFADSSDVLRGCTRISVSIIEQFSSFLAAK